MRKMRHGKDLTVVKESGVLLYFNRTFRGDRTEKNTLEKRCEKM